MTQRQMLLGRIDAAIREGDIPHAAELAEQALARNIEHPGILNLAAHAAIERDDLDRAITLLTRARALAPADVHVLNSLGIAYKRSGRFADAERAFDEAVTADPNYANGHFNKGTALEAQDRRDDARVAYERAVALDPDFANALGRLSYLAAMRGDYDAACAFATRAARGTPDEPYAMLKVAEFAIQRGDHAAVLALCERALAEAPDKTPAILILAKAELAAGKPEVAMERVRPLLEGERPLYDGRALALNVVARIEEQAGNFSAAFAAYKESKAEIGRNYAATYVLADGGTVQAGRAACAIEYFSVAPAELWRAQGTGPAVPVRRHVFMVGFPRSGTTFLEKALAGHGEIATMEEHESFADANRDFFMPAGGWQRLATLDAAGLARYRAAYWRTSRDAVPTLDGKVFIDKMPLNAMLLPFVARFFPGARVLFSLRDPRDVVLSCLKQQFSLTPSMYEFCSLESSARFYDAVMRLAEIYREKLGLTIMNTRYEDLIADFDSATQKICDFLGVAWEPGMRDIAATARGASVSTPSAPQLARGRYDGSGQWRNYRAEMAPVLPLLAPWVEKFGYPET